MRRRPDSADLARAYRIVDARATGDVAGGVVIEIELAPVAAHAPKRRRRSRPARDAELVDVLRRALADHAPGLCVALSKGPPRRVGATGRQTQLPG